MKHYLLTVLILFYASSVTAIGLSDEFKENLCSQLINTHISSVPATVSYDHPYYKDISNSSPLAQSCIYFDETDISVKVALDFDVRHYNKSIHALDADMECYFTSQYEWNCGYSAVRNLEVIVRWKYSVGFQRFTEYREWTDTKWQSDLLSLVETQLNENY